MKFHPEYSYPRFDGDAPLAPSPIGYGWELVLYNPYTRELTPQLYQPCESAEQAITSARSLLDGMAQAGWWIEQSTERQYQWCCSYNENGFVVVKYLTLEIGSVTAQ